MISVESSSSSVPGADLLARHISAEIGSAGGEAGRFESETLARSVAEFALGGAGRAVIPSDYLLILTCRALWAVGRGREARSLMRLKGPALGVDESFAEAAWAGTLFPALSARSNLPRALRSSEPAWSTGGGKCWVLDLRVVFAWLDFRLEMGFWFALRALIRELAGLWDQSSGAGALALRRARFIAGSVAASGRRGRRTEIFMDELTAYCRQALRMAARERGWKRVPEVMEMGN